MTLIRSWRLTLATFGLAAVLFTVGGLGIFGDNASSQPSVSGRPTTIAALQARLDRIPHDASGWASLGSAYIEEAKATANPAFYVDAERALRRSLKIDQASNFQANLGMAVLTAARHDFPSARTWAKRGLAINPSNAPLYGVLADAEINLGDYEAGSQAVQRMLDISPDGTALARASHVWELRGDFEQARLLMQRSLDDGGTPNIKVFARYFLGELALNSNDASGALTHYAAGLRVVPESSALLQGRAKAKMALGDTDGALADFASSVANGPEPGYFIEYGELLESLGRTDEAKRQYAKFEKLSGLFARYGERPDVDAVLFYADHGEPARALSVAEEALKTRRIVEMDDAYAWALHRNGRNEEALVSVTKALSFGARNAGFEFHAGAIQKALGNVDAAREHFAAALAINPAFHPQHAAEARSNLHPDGVAAPKSQGSSEPGIR